jgi:two-component system, LytTR family, response regulator
MHTAFVQQNNIPVHQSPVPHLLLPERNIIHFLKFNDIISVKALSNYCKVYCSNRQQPIVVARTLKWFQERLPAECFTRVHHGYLVNIHHIVSVAGNMICLDNGISAFISRRKRTGVSKALRA